MKINLTNYEEYFLLYADKELDETSRKMVEDFVLANPQLKKEFNIINDTVLSLNSISFSDKTSLLKDEGNNIQSELLLFLDNEKVANEKKLLDLINTNQSVSDEWSLLQKTKLPDEKIEYKNKALLYRYETPVYSFRFFKYAAAAMIIGIGLFWAIKMENRESDIPVNKEHISKATDSSVLKPDTAEIKSTETKEKSNEVKEENFHKPEENRNKKKGVPEKHENVEVQPKLNAPIINQAPANYVSTINNDPEEFDKINSEKKSGSIIPKQPLNVQMASYASAPELQQESIGHVFVVDEEVVNKSKAGRFLNKVKKIVNKSKTIDLPDHLTVGNFEISL